MQRNSRAIFGLSACFGMLVLLAGCGGGGGNGGGGGGGGGGGTGGAAGGTNNTLGTLPANVILYSRNGGATSTVYRINPDGTGGQVYVNLPASYSAFAPSPNDSRVAFAFASAPNNIGVYVNSTVSTFASTTVDAGPYIFVGSIQFSPDGTKLIYVAQGATGNAGLFVANSSGVGTPVRLDDADDAALGQGGTEIVYTRFFSSGQICLRKIDGTGFKQVTNNAFDNYLVQWTKDGQNVVFTSTRTGANAIWTMKWDGTNLVQVSSGNGEFASSPSGDGTHIAFSRLASDSSQNGIYTVAMNGTGEFAVLKTTDIEQTPVYWTSANGRATGGLGACIQQLSPRERKLVRR